MMYLAVSIPNSQQANSQTHWKLRCWELDVGPPSTLAGEAS